MLSLLMGHMIINGFQSSHLDVSSDKATFITATFGICEVTPILGRENEHTIHQHCLLIILQHLFSN